MTTEHKLQYREYLRKCQTAFFDPMKVTRGKVVPAGQLPVIMNPEEVQKLRGEKLPDRAAIDELINYDVLQAFINQSGILVNSVHNLAKSSGESYLGPAYTSPGAVAAQSPQIIAPATCPVMTPVTTNTVRTPYGMPPELWTTKNFTLGGGPNQQPGASNVNALARSSGPMSAEAAEPTAAVPDPVLVE